jgi:hypothetical protein
VDFAATDEVVFVSYPSQGDPHHPHCDVAAFVPHEDGLLEAKPLHADPGVHVSAFGGLMAAVGRGRRLYRTGSDDRTVQSLYVHPGRWAVYLDSEAWGWVADEEPGIARTLVAGDVLVTASSTGLLKTFVPDWGDARLQGQPPVQGAGPLLAYTGGVLAAASADGRVEVYAVGASGELTLKKSTTLPALRSLAFHPSGRFLYVSGSTLRTYLVEADGTLRPYAETGASAGLLAVTAPPVP